MQQWQMDSRDLRRRMMLSPTRREGEGSDRGMQKRGSKYEPPPLPLESDFCPQSTKRALWRAIGGQFRT